MACASHYAPAMKPLTLGLALALGLFGIACSSASEEATGPTETQVTRVATSLERKLAAPIAIPSDTAIGTTMDAFLEAQSAKLVAVDPLMAIGANGERCTILRFNDDKGVEQLRREKCSKGTDTIVAGKLTYRDENGDGKIDVFSDRTGATDENDAYGLFDDDHDGKLDRMIEPATRIASPIALTDFAESVTITANGKIASRTRADKDHDGKFEMESVTATTSFRISTTTDTSAPASH